MGAFFIKHLTITNPGGTREKARDEVTTQRQENQGLILGRIRSELKSLVEKMLEEEITSYLQEEKSG